MCQFVFVTALYYWLVVGAEAVTSFSTRRFSALPTDAVQSILTCTLKISAFYGLYTWLTHTLFGINFVVIPSGAPRLELFADRE